MLPRSSCRRKKSTNGRMSRYGASRDVGTFAAIYSFRKRRELYISLQGTAEMVGAPERGPHLRGHVPVEARKSAAVERKKCRFSWLRAERNLFGPFVSRVEQPSVLPRDCTAATISDR